MRKGILPWLLLVATGCGQYGQNQVTGKVYFEGKPVSLGAVVFVGTDGAPRTGSIEPDGSFLVKGVTPGPARIAVASLNPAQLDADFEIELQEKFAKLGIPLPPPEPQNTSEWFPIPKAYGDVDTSELKADIQRGTTHFDIHLAEKK